MAGKRKQDDKRPFSTYRSTFSSLPTVQNELKVVTTNGNERVNGKAFQDLSSSKWGQQNVDLTFGQIEPQRDGILPIAAEDDTDENNEEILINETVSACFDSQGAGGPLKTHSRYG